MGQMAQFLKQNSIKSFPSNIETNHKQCMAITLRSGKELDDSTEVKRQAEIKTKENNAENKKEPASA